MKKFWRIWATSLSAIAVAIGTVGPAAATLLADPNIIHFGPVALNTTVTDPIAFTVDAGYALNAVGGSSGLTPPFGFDFGAAPVSRATAPSTKASPRRALAQRLGP